LESIWIVQNELTDLNALTGCKKLKKLCLDMNYKLTDISGVSGLPELEYLNINETNVNDLGALKDCISLQELKINDTKITDLTPLETLSGLKDIALNRITADVSKGTKNREILKTLISCGVKVFVEIIKELEEEC
jgi:Leucine-rich repeat (LRR) protein